MNIFQVLSQGKSRLHEPSMSAMLGYLLDSGKDHGLGDLFLRNFLTAVDKDRFDKHVSEGFIHVLVELEAQHELNGSKKEIDIQLQLLDHEKNEVHRIVIENKIKPGAASSEQLNEYYQAVRSDQDTGDLTVVFLTPNTSSKGLKDEFEMLSPLNSDAKYWLYWSEHDNSISNIVQSALKMEIEGKINPINEYMRHTLKAFVRHIENTISIASSSSKIRYGEDIGEVIDRKEIALYNGEKYELIRRDSTQIQAFNISTEEKEKARKIMREYIVENNIPIDSDRFNTRMLGKKLFEYFEN